MITKSLYEIIKTMDVNILPEYKNININNITYDSRKVKEGGLFVAIHGYKSDGHEFIKSAEKNGAVAVLAEKQKKDISIPQIQVKNSRLGLAHAVKEFYKSAISDIKTIGITGTNGKTTTSYLIQSILNQAEMHAGLIGTIEYVIGNKIIPSWNTTPESSDLCKMLYEMKLKGQKFCVMEVSSHGLALNRADAIDFDVGVFTNLSQDHLDFHKDLKEYFEAKFKLFQLLKPKGIAVVNFDSSYSKSIIQNIRQNYISFGINCDAQIKANYWRSDFDGLTLKISTPSGALEIKSSLIGQFNVENILAAVSVGIAFNLNLETIIAGIETVYRIPGRLEPIKLNENKMAVVDYSHTPDALEKALIELVKIKKNDLWVVFGCGGDRDKRKRPLMGSIVEKYATNIIVTSDNPRSENPDQIIDDILRGIKNNRNVNIDSDRRAAIEFALKKSKPGDIILVAGKGHETYQEISGVKYDFDDRQIIRELER